MPSPTTTTTNLRAALEQRYATWKDDLSPAWRAFFAGADVDPARVPPGLALVPPYDVIFPGRKGSPPAGARPDAHVARAFDGLTPAEVRVVVIGQDPYPHVEQATGRSFEQADVNGAFAKITPSLRRILQAVALARTGDRRYVDGGAKAWQHLLSARAAGTLDLPPPLPLWDRWQGAGVMFVNAATTFNKFQGDYQRAHLAFWAPVVGQLVSGLARRPGPGTVFVAWGGFAQGVLTSAKVEQAARDAGRWGTHVAIVSGPHPNATGAGPPFLAGRDPLSQVNDALTQINEAAIAW
jgi:uracil-DNA glycosylase